jgi:hypothetical protein
MASSALTINEELAKASVRYSAQTACRRFGRVHTEAKVGFTWLLGWQALGRKHRRFPDNHHSTLSEG